MREVRRSRVEQTENLIVRRIEIMGFNAAGIVGVGLCFFVSTVGFSAESSWSELPKTQGHEFATIPEGKTLPEGVVRTRLGYGSVTGNGYKYDEDGAKKSSVVDVKATGGAVVVEYGLSPKWSLQFQQDFVGSYEVSTNKSGEGYQALKGDLYAANTGGARNSAEFVQGVAAKLAAVGVCGANVTAAACTAAILAGSVNAPQNIAVSSSLTIPSGANIKTVLDTVAAQTDAAIEAGIDNSAKRSGGKGMADTTIGALYEIMDEGPLAISLGGGVRYPTGNRNRGLNEAKTGRGLTEIGIRVNVDYLVSDAARVSWQNASESMLASGKYKEEGTDVTISRSGVRNHGFLVFKPSLASLSEGLKTVGPKLGLAYDYDSEERIKVGALEEIPVTSKASEIKWLLGATATMFDYGLPLQLELEYQKSHMGKNVIAATDNFVAQLKGFYKF
jgi:hypothetical protein